MSPESLNFFVAFILAGTMLLIAIFHYAHGRSMFRALKFDELPSTTASYYFYLFGVCALCLVYVVIWKVPSIAIASDYIRGALLLIANVSNICFLLAACAYGNGDEFSLVHGLKYALFAFAANFFVDALVWGLEQIFPTDKIIFTAIEIAPNISLSGAAYALLGWFFFARWGGPIGFTFFVLNLLYSLLQFPIYLALGFGAYLNTDATARLADTFPILAGGKILIVMGFVYLLLHSDNLENFGKPQRLPTRAIPLPMGFKHTLKWLLTIVAAIIASAATRFIH